jgi:protein-disulfide isomerase
MAVDQAAAASRSGSGTLARSSGAARREARARRGQDRSRSLRRFVMPGLLGAAIVAGFAILAGSQLAGPSSAGDLPATRPVLGRSDAALVIREYGDFQCPSCGAFFRVVEPQVRAAFIDTGLARLEWHDFAWIGPESRDAANAARCAGDQGRFWDFHDLLYRSQSGENQGAFAKDRLKAMGTQLGLEPVEFIACVDGDGHASAVQSDFAEVRTRGFNSTPTFLVGDQRIVGAQPFEVFEAAINAELGLN